MEVKLSITPGVARVNSASLVYTAPNIACIEIDMHSKYAVSDGGEDGGQDCAPAIYIEADERTLHKHTRFKRDTRVAFPEFKGWKVYLQSCCRYTCRVVLVRVTEGT